MDRLNTFQLVTAYVKSHMDWVSGNQQQDYQLITDKEKGHIQLFKAGFNKVGKFRFHVIFHFQIKGDGKVWVLVNNPDIEVGIEFMKAGLNSQQIVVGFIPPKLRAYSGYATA
ncbi:MAG: element excision factor XisI family protein [Bacteroidota bacterium]